MLAPSGEPCILGVNLVGMMGETRNGGGPKVKQAIEHLSGEAWLSISGGERLGKVRRWDEELVVPSGRTSSSSGRNFSGL